MPLALVAVAALLGGCMGHHMPHGSGGAMGPRGEAMYANPLVSVKGGVIAVSPDPLVFTKDEKNVRITWRLGAGDLRFPENGIVIEGPRQDEIVDCKPGEGGREFSCLNRNTRPGKYKYTIRVMQDGKELRPRDPEITNLS
ncbi:MAG: hypothetical protein LCI02_13135 [Proteobacteria bacterium]|nr:hypothetical protein [Pseudomonadota bacterium]